MPPSPKLNLNRWEGEWWFSSGAFVRTPQHLYQNFHVSKVTFFLSCVINLKITELGFFMSFQWIDVKNNRCLRGLSLISIILWEYYKKISKYFDIKTLCYYSLKNKRIISLKIEKLIFFETIGSVPSNMIKFILITTHAKIN